MFVLFDLDGTLTDPFVGITSCVQFALRHFGIDEPDRRVLTPYIGPPLRESFMTLHGLDEQQADEALRLYRVRFSDVGMFENRVYDGIPALLRRLREAGARLAVATSKPTVYSEKIVAHFALTDYFETVVGSELSGARVEKAEVIAEALRRLNAAPADTWMVGDRRFDIEGAHKNGLRAVGVRYGYALPDELETVGADAIVGTVDELGDTLLGL